MRDGKGGFTLIELLIVVGVMGILASVGFVSFTKSLQKSRDAARKANLDQIAKAVESYSLDFGVYPDSCGGEMVACDGDVCSWGSSMTNDGKTYMQDLPKDPLGSAYYVYTANTDGKSFQVYARLENTSDAAAEPAGYDLLCTDDDLECNYGESSPNIGLTPNLSDNSNCP